MKTIVYGALALALAGSPSYAANNSWSGLDQEIDSLSASLAAQNTTTGPKINGYLRTSLRYNADNPIAYDSDGDGDIDGADDTNDQFGFQLDNVRIEIKGDLTNDYSYKVSFDLADGTATIRDAYGEFKITDNIKGRMGRYKVPFLRSSLISKSKILFLDRTQLGQIFNFRDLGLQLSGMFETVTVWLNAMNGTDTIGDDWYYNARVTADLMGTGTGMTEGAYGAGDEVNVSVGAAIGDDSAIDSGLHWAIEASVTSGPFAVTAEFADFDEDILVANPISGSAIGDTSPWDITASYLFTDVYELGVRYQDTDDDVTDAVQYGAVVNRYVDNHNIKWQLQWMHTDVDVTGVDDTDEIALGLTLAF